MEVTTVSTSAISPTEGDDLCEIDVTSVTIHSVTLLIGLCGLAGNGAVLCLLSLKSTITNIFNLAVADFVFLLFTVPSTLVFLLEDVSCSPIVPLMYVSFLFQLSVVSYYWGLYWLTGISFFSDMSKLCQLCSCCRVPLRLLWFVSGVQYWAFYALFTVIPTLTFLCPSHEQELCRVSLISLYALVLLLVAAPVVISRTINFITATCGSQQQQPTRRDIVIFLIVLFTLLLILWNFLHQLGFIVVPSHVVFLLICINSSIKPFIYFLLGRCWRPCSMESLQLSLQRVFDERKGDTAHVKDTTRDTAVSGC